jgi:uncharacterized protein Smg (DUF494 family)
MVQDRILEIVVYLMNRLTDHQESVGSFDEMSADLRSMGFTDSEISSAYSWLLKHFEDYPESFSFSDKQAGSRSVRILSDPEKKIISPDAYGYLVQLRQLNLISAEQLEMILDRCSLYMNEPIDLNEMKLFASAALFDAGSSEYPNAVWMGDPESEPIN